MRPLISRSQNEKVEFGIRTAGTCMPLFPPPPPHMHTQVISDGGDGGASLCLPIVLIVFRVSKQMHHFNSGVNASFESTKG